MVFSIPGFAKSRFFQILVLLNRGFLNSGFCESGFCQIKVSPNPGFTNHGSANLPNRGFRKTGFLKSSFANQVFQNSRFAKTRFFQILVLLNRDFLKSGFFRIRVLQNSSFLKPWPSQTSVLRIRFRQIRILPHNGFPNLDFSNRGFSESGFCQIVVLRIRFWQIHGFGRFGEAGTRFPQIQVSQIWVFPNPGFDKFMISAGSAKLELGFPNSSFDKSRFCRIHGL